MKKLRLGVIGAGSYTIMSHLPNLQKWSDKIDFTAVSRLEEAPLERIKDRFGFARATTEWREVLEAHPDLVIVGSPARFHHEQVKAALEAGAHVMCEKPFTIEPRDAWDLDATAKALDRHLVLSLGRNYLAVVLQAKKLMTDDGGIGDVEQMTVHMASVHRELLRGDTGVHPSSAPDSSPNTATWTDPEISGGGYGQGQLSHLLGVALWLTELRGQEVSALMSSPLKTDVEYHVAASVRYENGAIGTVGGGACHMGSNENRQQFDIRIIGSEGQLHLDMERDFLWRYKGPDDDVRVPLEDKAGLYNCDGPIDTIVRLALGEQVPNNSPAELGARIVEVLDGAYRSAKNGRPESIDLG